MDEEKIYEKGMEVEKSPTLERDDRAHNAEPLEVF
jgi:hypothetical protein